MAWPYESSWYFEDGTVADLTESGSGAGQGDVAHFSDLARSGFTPFRGAYCYRVLLDGTASTSLLTDSAVSILEVGPETTYFGFALYLSEDFSIASSATITILNVLDGAAVSSAIHLLDDSGTLRFAVRHNTGGTDQVIGTTYAVVLGSWMWVELQLTQSADSAQAFLYVTVEGEPASTTVANTAASQNSTEAAVDSAQIGLCVNASTGNAGTMLFDAYHYHDPADTNVARIVAPDQTWELVTTVHVAQHVFVGPGYIDNVAMLSGNSTLDNEVIVYDTDDASNDDVNIVAHLKNTVANETVDVSGERIPIQRGAYIEIIDGTGVLSLSDVDSPRAIVSMSPRYFGSRSNIVNYGKSRRA